MDWEKIDVYLKKEELKKIDKAETRKRIIRLLNLYLDYKSKMMVLGEQRVTTNFQTSFSRTNRLYNSNIEQTVLFNAENEYQEFVTLFENAMNSLDKLEYQVFYNFYFLKKKAIACYMDLEISETEFYRVKEKAINNMALFLGCAIFEDDTKKLDSE